MEVYGPVLADIRTGFVERKLDAKVVESHSHEGILIFIRKEFLDMFRVQDGVAVAGELLSPNWGGYLDDNLDRLPCWMAEVKYRTVDKDRGIECVEEMDRVMAYHERRIRN